MKKYLSAIAFILTAAMLTGCSSEMSATNGATSASGETYGGTDIGGEPSGGLGEFFDDFADAVTGGGMKSDAAMDAVAEGGAMMDGATTAPSIADGGSFKGEDITSDGLPSPIKPEPDPEPQANMLTGGEWNDNDHWADWDALYSSHPEWRNYKSEWKIDIDNRISVKVTAGGKPVEGARVSCKNAIADAVTDNEGMAYLFYKAINGPTEQIDVEYNGATAVIGGVMGNADLTCELSGVNPEKPTKLDFMIMCDTTGSMGDELSYLKVELENIVRKVEEENSNVAIRTSVNFYRDEGDDYVVRQFPFTDDIEQSAEAIKEQSPDGGGDFPEAVHTALNSAVNDHDWDEDSVKIMFLVLDAPPHDDAQIVASVNKYVRTAAEKGIRIVPIASSGIDKSTEYLLRTMAFTTGGTYTFLTNHSGIGGGHIEPTVGAYNVEKLSDMMIRIVNSYLA